MSKVDHTSVPWMSKDGMVYGENGRVIATMVGNVKGLPIANAVFIVKAVNSHDNLYSALCAATAALCDANVDGCEDEIIAECRAVILEAETT